MKSVADARDVARVLTLGISGTPMPSYVNSIGEDGVRDLAAFTAYLWRLEPRSLDTSIPGGNVMPTAEESRSQLGHLTYLANCAGCHGKLGRGDGAAAVGFAVRPANLTAGFFKFKSTPEGCAPTLDDVKRTLRRGVPGSSMPDWKLHTESELDAVTAYLWEVGASKGRRGAPLAVPVIAPARVEDAGAVQRGRALYAANCSVCHGVDGQGDGAFATILADYRGEPLRPRNLVEDPLKLGESAEDLYRAVSFGFEGTPMPGFAGSLDESARLDIVAFLLGLRPMRSASIR
jgi:mono/diheme cytochrome c family protein